MTALDNGTSAYLRTAAANNPTDTTSVTVARLITSATTRQSHTATHSATQPAAQRQPHPPWVPPLRVGKGGTPRGSVKYAACTHQRRVSVTDIRPGSAPDRRLRSQKNLGSLRGGHG